MKRKIKFDKEYNRCMKLYKEASVFSPLGKLPKDFNEYFSIQKVVLNGITMFGVVALAVYKPDTILGEYRGIVFYGSGYVDQKFYRDTSYIFRFTFMRKNGDFRAKYIDGKNESKSSWPRFVFFQLPLVSYQFTVVYQILLPTYTIFFSRYINRHEDESKCNCMFVDDGTKAFVMATKTIKKGDQLLMNYLLEGE